MRLRVVFICLFFVLAFDSGSTPYAVAQDALGTWSTKAYMPTARRAPAAVELDGKIYVIGGQNGQYYNVVERYDPETDTWETVAPMPTERAWLVAEAVNGRIYAIGGNNPTSGKLGTVEEYDPNVGPLGTWTTKSPMPTPRDDAVSGVVNGRIYVAGGWRGSALDVVEEYDPATDSWATKTSMIEPRAMASSAVLNGNMYVFGGFDSGGDHNQTFEYNPVSDTWVVRTDMLTRRSRSAAAVVSEKIYVIGGYNKNGVERYDPSVNLWQTMNPMPSERGDIAAAEMDGSIYVFGGRVDWFGAVLSDTEAAAFSGTGSPPGEPSNQIQNGSFETNLTSWSLGPVGSAEAILSRDESTAAVGSASAKVDITVPATWLGSIQFVQNGLSLVEGQDYTLSFRAKASEYRPIGIVMRMSSPPWTQYSNQTQAITTSWQEYQLSFIAGASDTNAVLQFALGQYASTVWLDGIVFGNPGPSITVEKSADPASISEPGGDVTFTVVVTNTGDDTVTLESMIDDTYGDLDGQGTCSVPQTMGPGDNYQCDFTATVSGSAGDMETSTVTATASDDSGNTVQATGGVTVNITGSGPPNQIRNGGFEPDLSFWMVGTIGSAEALLSQDESTAAEGFASAKVNITAPATWLGSVQFVQSGISLVAGQSYTLSFWAKATDIRPIGITLRMSSSPWTQYTTHTQAISTTWEAYQLSFTAGAGDTNATLAFSLGQYASTVWLDDIVMAED